MDITTIDSLTQALPSNTIGVEGISILDLAFKGGWVMLVLLLLSCVALYIFVRKLIEIRAAGRDDRFFMERIRDYVAEGKTSSALKLCEDVDTPSAHMIKKGISRLGRPMADILVIVENVGNVEVGRLERGLPILATIASGAPMIGFLGTVTGMVRAFFDMASVGGAGVDIALLSNGIYEALITTVGGLVVGIASLFGYNYLTVQLDRVINKMESKTVEFMDMLNETL